MLGTGDHDRSDSFPPSLLCCPHWTGSQWHQCPPSGPGKNIRTKCPWVAVCIPAHWFEDPSCNLKTILTFLLYLIEFQFIFLSLVNFVVLCSSLLSCYNKTLMKSSFWEARAYLTYTSRSHSVPGEIRAGTQGGNLEARKETGHERVLLTDLLPLVCAQPVFLYSPEPLTLGDNAHSDLDPPKSTNNQKHEPRTPTS